MSRPAGLLRQLWRSMGFRLAVHYAVLVGITMLAALAIIYLQTVGTLHQRMARQVSATAQQLAAQFEDEGVEAVKHSIARAMVDGRSTDEELLLLADAQGTPLAGNLDALPPPGADGQRYVLRDGRSVRGWIIVRALPQGHVLVVGQDLGEQEALEELIISASAAAALVAMLLLAGGIFVFRQEIERSVGAVRRTAARIAAGDLRERVRLSSGQEDEFALLERDINAMLDRIQSLMDGVRHVSDTIAHNLRTPLTRVLTRLREAGADDVPAPQRQAAIHAAIDELQELNRVFEKLLQIAEAEAGARRQRFARVALEAVVADVAELYDAVAEDLGATVRQAHEDTLPVLGDRDLLAGVVANLLDNALKYGGPGCTVELRTAWLDGQAVLTVQDDGPGVPPEALARLGERFLRLQPERPGHGLGLASVQAVVALHGGVLRYENAAPGLRVRVALPLDPR
ncbi:HAMP domain-containing sensor histidine kinase [Xenophilus sp. Marseille-Q4582]|uniref:sensor histidine kinase n=1 Tax=Xenophilus sp. Marseille-Q4582 TaxID=2866600 RepID=UPI001CE46B0E|nr:HAMP domain-containing sensor histidine kinase [Xenophilus sp. Marseille-Q4582]